MTAGMVEIPGGNPCGRCGFEVFEVQPDGYRCVRCGAVHAAAVVDPRRN